MHLQEAPTAQLMQAPTGAAGIRETLKLMSELARKAKLSPLIRERAKSLTCNLPQKDRWGEISAVFQYVQQGVRYLRDPRDVETVVAPETMVEDLFPAGDCDDKCLLLAALLES